nr:MAG TPA: hypothetical protein [Caudoviricetes sp.]
MNDKKIKVEKYFNTLLLTYFYFCSLIEFLRQIKKH